MKKLLAIFATIVMLTSVITIPVFATDKTKKKEVSTAVLNTCGSSDDGVACILNLIVDIMSIGVGILGVIGITVVGIQYLTAGGDEGKTRKSKQRMFEIVIGLVSYVVIYAVLKWLLPGFSS